MRKPFRVQDAAGAHHVVWAFHDADAVRRSARDHEIVPIGSVEEITDPDEVATARADLESQFKPNLDDDSVPMCSFEDCPMWDGKYCRELGDDPDKVCIPAVRMMARVTRSPRTLLAASAAVLSKTDHAGLAPCASLALRRATHHTELAAVAAEESELMQCEALANRGRLR